MPSELELELVLDLAAEYHAAIAGGGPADLSVVCRDHPHLIAQVRQLLSQARGLSAVGEVATETDEAAGREVEPMPASVGEYDLIRELGRGTFGVAFRGRDRRLHRDVAVKLLRARWARHKGARRRFLDEARITAGLQHPSIPPVHELGEHTDGRPWMAMKLIRGHTLQELFERADAGFDPLALFESLCHGMGYAHSKGVVHRDLKPANVMVGSYAEVQILDWGLGKVLATDPPPGGMAGEASDAAGVESGGAGEESTGTAVGPERASDRTRAGTAIGSPAYMSPEQAIGAVTTIDRRSDVFGLGGILCRLLTGHPPFVGGDGESTRQLAAMGRVQEAFGRLDRCGAEPELVALCKWCLAPDREHRPADAGQVADAFTAYLGRVAERARDADRATAAAAADLRAVQARADAERRSRKAATRLLVVSAVAVLLTAVLGMSVWNVRAVGEKNGQLEVAVRAEVAAREELSAAREREAVEAYVSHLSAAQYALARGQIGRARERLESCPPDRRGWEWRYLVGRCHPDAEAVVRTPHADIYGLVVRPDRTQLATFGNDPTVRLWDADTLTPQGELTGTGDKVRAACYRPGRAELATASDAGWVVWDVGTRRPRLSRPAAGAVHAAAFSADGRWLATGAFDGTIALWDADSGEQVWAKVPRPKQKVNTIAFGPDDRLACGCNEGTVVFLDRRTGEVTVPTAEPVDPAYGMAFAPDGQMLVAAHADQQVRVWAGDGSRLTATLPKQGGSVRAVAFDKAGGKMATGGDDRVVRVWDARTLELVREFRGHEDTITGVAFDDTGGRLFTTGDGTIRVWPLDRPSPPTVLNGPKAEVNRVRFSVPDGRTVTATVADGEVFVWDRRSPLTPTVITAHSKEAHGLAFSPDGDTFATGSLDRTLRLWSRRTGGLVRECGMNGAARGLQFSADGELLVAGASRQVGDQWKGEVSVRRTIDLSAVWTVVGHEGVIRAAAFDPTGRLVATASYDRTVKVWDAASGQELAVLTGHTASVWDLAFSPDGKVLATCGADRTVRLWGVPDGRPLGQTVAHNGTTFAVAFSPDGTRLATTGFDRLVKVWDFPSMRELIALDGHEAEVSSVAFSPDGHVLASGSADKTVRVWDGTPVDLSPRPAR